MKTVPAAKFKANCLALMDKVDETGEFVVITKHWYTGGEASPSRRERRNIGGAISPVR